MINMPNLDRFQAISRIGRKPKPVAYIDMETRSTLSLDPGAREDVICGAYKIGDGPVTLLPWEAACARKDWAEADRLRREFFAAIKVQQQVRYYEDLAWIDKSWLTKKFLTLAAWARTIFKR
jgi:hypothetical protein